MACAGSGRCLHPRFFSKRFRFCPAARINASQLTHSSSRKRSRRMPCQSLQISRRAVRPTHCAYGGLSCRARSVDSHVPDPDTPHPHSGTDCVPAYWWYTGPSAGTHYSPRHRPDSVVVGPSIAPAQSAVLCPPGRCAPVQWPQCSPPCRTCDHPSRDWATVSRRMRTRHSRSSIGWLSITSDGVTSAIRMMRAWPRCSIQS